ncbi:MAG: hypothetical protein AAF333_06695 [Planctomycetota bacterium]
MHYMPWYQTLAIRGRWGEHWTGFEKQHNPGELDEDGLPDIWSHYHPLVGVYDSTDLAVLECQLLQMKLAGVDGVIVDWYGLSGAADYPPIHQATQAMYDASDQYGMSFTVCFEDRTVERLVKDGALRPEGIAEHLSETFAWVEEHWFAGPHYFRIDGRPLLLNFGPIYVKDAGAWTTAFGNLETPPKFFALHHLWRNAGADGGFTWVHPEVWEGDPDRATIRDRLIKVFTRPSGEADRVIVSAVAGFNDVYEKSFVDLDYRDGSTLREALDVGIDGPWPVIQLVTWNDYGEGTMIEPTHEFGYRFLEVIQEARRRELGEGFVFTAKDLRLPARLLGLRRAKYASPIELDRIAMLLSAGRSGEAKKALDELGG